MPPALILASGSAIRLALLQRSGLTVEALPARVDEEAIRAAMLAEGAAPRDIADALAEAKARKVSLRRPGALVIGADQILVHNGRLLAKPATPAALREQLVALRGSAHSLLSAIVVCRDGAPLWRFVGEARLTMRNFSDTYLEGYLARNWPGLADTVGGYKLEEEGVRLIARLDGSYFTVLGLPLPELIDWLALRGDIEG